MKFNKLTLLYILCFCEVVSALILLIFASMVIGVEATTTVCTYVTYISAVIFFVSSLLVLLLAPVENERIEEDKKP